MPPVAASVALPSEVVPRAKLTVPDGEAAPVAGLTKAVTVVVEFCAMVGGLAAATVVVAAGGRAAVTVTEAAEPLKVLLPA